MINLITHFFLSFLLFTSISILFEFTTFFNLFCSVCLFKIPWKHNVRCSRKFNAKIRKTIRHTFRFLIKFIDSPKTLFECRSQSNFILFHTLSFLNLQKYKLNIVLWVSHLRMHEVLAKNKSRNRAEDQLRIEFTLAISPNPNSPEFTEIKRIIRHEGRQPACLATGQEPWVFLILIEVLTDAIDVFFSYFVAEKLAKWVCDQTVGFEDGG